MPVLARRLQFYSYTRHVQELAGEQSSNREVPIDNSAVCRTLYRSHNGYVDYVELPVKLKTPPQRLMACVSTTSTMLQPLHSISGAGRWTSEQQRRSQYAVVGGYYFTVLRVVACSPFPNLKNFFKCRGRRAVDVVLKQALSSW